MRTEIQDKGCEERLDADDAILARAALVGQAWAQREIWFRFAPMVFGFLHRALGAQHDHDDLTQEIFLRVFNKLHTLEKASAIRSFVYAVAFRVVSEQIRRFRVRRRAVAQNQDLGMASTSTPVDFEARETLLRVHRLLDRMHDKHRAVFVLRHVENMDMQQVALSLDISLTTAKRRLSKAVVSIKESIAKEESRSQRHDDTTRSSRLWGAGYNQRAVSHDHR